MQDLHSQRHGTARGDEYGTARGDEYRQRDHFARKSILTAGVVLALLIIVYVIWYLLHVFLLLFAGLLLATLLHVPADWISEHTPIGERWALLLVILVVFGLLGLGGWWIVPRVASEFDQLVQTLPQGFLQVQDFLGQYGWGQQFLERMPPLQEVVFPEDIAVVSRISRISSGVVGLITSFFVILFTGLYLAFQRDMYTNGIVKLFPQSRRPHMHAVFEDLGYVLKWWLIGRVFAMIVLGTFTGLGLWLIGVPFALALGVITGLLSFVPIIGSILAVIPPALVALTQGPTILLYVLLLYFGTQFIESYLLTPMVQSKAVSLPPVLALSVQLILGVLSGLLGVALAFPIAIVGLVLVKRLYIQDVLGDTSVQVVNH